MHLDASDDVGRSLHFWWFGGSPTTQAHADPGAIGPQRVTPIHLAVTWAEVGGGTVHVTW